MNAEDSADLALVLEDAASTVEEAMATSLGDMIFVLVTAIGVLWWGRRYGWW